MSVKGINLFRNTILISIVFLGCNSNVGLDTKPEDDERTNRLRTYLKITEIHYHPMDEETIDGNEFEFIELKNMGDSDLDLSGIAFTSGISYSFKSGTILEPDCFIVLASNRKEFQNRYSFPPFDEYSGKLKGSGEKIVLSETGLKRKIIEMTYDDQSPWPVKADGLGYSLVPVESNPTGDPNDPSYWKISGKIHGSPGKDDAY